LTWPVHSLTVLLTVLAAWLIFYKLAEYLKLEKKGFEVKPLVMLYKTARFNRLLDDLSARFSGFWSLYSTVSIFIAFGLALFSVYILAENLFKFFMKPEEALGFIPILPGITVGLEPLLYFLPAILLGLTFHELLHGVVARLENIPVKSAGIIVVFLLFGGFVEPDEESFRKSRTLSRLRVLSSGPSANLALAFIAFLVLNVFFQPPQGLLVYSVSPDSPLYGLGLDRWSIVEEVNGVKLGLTRPSIPLVTPYTDPLRELRSLNLTSRVVVKTDKGVFNVTLPGPPYRLGIRFYIYPYSPTIFGDLIPRSATFTAYILVMYTCSINIALAVFNMLPVYPFDGYGFIEAFLDRVENGLLRKAASIALNVFGIGLLVLNIGLTFLRFGVLR